MGAIIDKAKKVAGIVGTGVGVYHLAVSITGAPVRKRDEPASVYIFGIPVFERDAELNRFWFGVIPRGKRKPAAEDK
jgi:hypothetical protein